MNDSSDEKPEKKLKQTTMGNFTTKQPKDKEKKEEATTTINRRTRFNQNNSDNWTSGWSTGWDSWRTTDWKKKDTEDYRNEYPGKKDNPKLTDNLKFYKNEMKSYPDGDFIDNIHKKWKGDYKLLERHHGYIQWLFPIRESGMNFHAQELQKHEAKEIIEDPKAHRRVLKSYKMMLDFYGMKITDETTGTIGKTDNWKERFSHLNRSYHNYLRITRILKCLGELGYEHMKVKFLEFVIEEALEKKTLKNCYKSCKDYWVETLRNDGERKHIQEYMKKVEDGYESGGDPVDDYNVNWDEDMEDESQEMKNHSDKIASDSEEEKQNVAKKGSEEEGQMAADKTVQNVTNETNDNSTENDTEMETVQNSEVTSSEIDSKVADPTGIQKDCVNSKMASSTTGTSEPQTSSGLDTQPLNLNQI